MSGEGSLGMIDAHKEARSLIEQVWTESDKGIFLNEIETKKLAKERNYYNFSTCLMVKILEDIGDECFL